MLREKVSLQQFSIENTVFTDRIKDITIFLYVNVVQNRTGI